MFQIVPDIKHEIQGKPTNKPPLSANPSQITEICQNRYFLRKRLENLTNLSNFYDSLFRFKNILWSTIISIKMSISPPTRMKLITAKLSCIKSLKTEHSGDNDVVRR